MKTRILFLFAILVTFLSISNINSQLKNQVLFDPTGNVYVVGQTYCFQDTDVTIIKYEPGSGNLIWQKKMNLQGATYFKSAIIKNNNIFIAALNSLNGNRKIYTIKCDLNGNTSYTIYDMPVGDYGNAITSDNSGNIFIAGRTDMPAGFPKLFVIKYNANLDSQWTYIYRGPLAGNFDEALCVKTDRFGNVFAAGYASQSQNSYNTYDYLTVKLNSSGVLQWAKRHNDIANLEDQARAIEADSSGNVFVTGYNYLSAGGSVIFTIKYNSNGDSVSSASYQCLNTNSLNQPRAMIPDNAGNLYITGTGQCDTTGNLDCVTIKYNSSLVPQWTVPSVYSGTGNCYSYSITYANAHIYITGESDSAGLRRFLTIKYDANNGNELWHWNFSNSSYNFATSVGTDALENVYVSGYSSLNQILTAKYSGWVNNYGFCPPFGIEIISSIVPDKFGLYQNYPNPFNPSTIFKFDISNKTAAKVIVYDVLGRQVEELLNADLKPGTYEAIWNGTNYPSGVYFYSLQTSSFSQTKKMILIK